MPVLKQMVCGALVLAALSNQAFGASAPDTHATWTTPIKPFRIYGNSFYVGSKGLSAVLVTSPQGHILIDGTLKQNAPLIEANIRALGFKLSDVKAIVNSHAHGDHAGALAQLAKDTGVPVYASQAGALALRLGGKDPQDPQYDGHVKFPPVDAKAVADLGHVRVGDLDLVGHDTPGHTSGSTSWTWQSCEKGKCLHMVYSDIREQPRQGLGRHEVRVGDVVGFQDRDSRPRQGTILRLNDKTVTLQSETMQWRVGYTLLHRVIQGG